MSEMIGMHYALAPYVGSGRELDPFRPRGHDQPSWRAIDLRPDGARPEGYALVVTPERVRERGVVDLGPSADDRWSLRILASRLGVPLTRGNLRHAAASLLLDGREDGTRWHPIWPERDGMYRIWLGGLLWAMPTLRGGASYLETFTGANSVNLNADQTWTEIQGAGWGLTSNQAVIGPGISEGLCIARMNGALATVDQRAALTLVTFTYVNLVLQVGPLIRKAFDTVQTFYYHRAARDTTINEHNLVKRITGTATLLGSPDATDPAGSTLLGVEASGSSIAGLRGGSTTIGPITDTEITTGFHGGLFGFTNHASNVIAVDDFTVEDIGALPSPHPYNPWMQRAPLWTM